MYFWKQNSNMFPEFLYHPHLSLQVKGLESSAPGHQGVFYRGCHEEFKHLFSQEDGILFCNDVCSVVEVLGHEYNPDQWCLFIDSSKVSLKVVLLYNVPLAYATNMKESYESTKLLLGKIKYDEFKWKLCGDLKLWQLLGMQLGYAILRSVIPIVYVRT
jgi:hypothetical protein